MCLRNLFGRYVSEHAKVITGCTLTNNLTHNVCSRSTARSHSTTRGLRDDLPPARFDSSTRPSSRLGQVSCDWADRVAAGDQCAPQKVCYVDMALRASDGLKPARDPPRPIRGPNLAARVTFGSKKHDMCASEPAIRHCALHRRYGACGCSQCSERRVMTGLSIRVHDHVSHGGSSRFGGSHASLLGQTGHPCVPTPWHSM